MDTRRNGVFICPDDRVLLPALFVADGVVKHATKAGSDLDVFIVTPDKGITAEMRSYANEREIKFIHDLNRSAISDLTMPYDRFSLSTFDRINVPHHLAKTHRRLFYLDIDVSIHGDVGRIFDLDLQGNALAASPIWSNWADGLDDELKTKMYGDFRKLGMSEPFSFFNTGVMLIDVDEWLNSQMAKRTVEFYRANQELCIYPLEYSMNGVLDGSFTKLSPVWNVWPTSPLYSLEAPRIEPVVRHYAGPVKPWRKYQMWKGLFQQREEYKLYDQWAKTTPWPNWLREEWSVRELFYSAREECYRLYDLCYGIRPTGSMHNIRQRYGSTRAYLAGMTFDDVEQGIVVNDGRVMRLADPVTLPVE